MDITNLLFELRAKINVLRSFERLFGTYKFQDIYERVGEEDRKDLIKIMEKSSMDDVRYWMNTMRFKYFQINEMNLRELRHKARLLSIPGYGIKDKTKLLSEIADAESRGNSSQGRRNPSVNESISH